LKSNVFRSSVLLTDVIDRPTVINDRIKPAVEPLKVNRNANLLTLISFRLASLVDHADCRAMTLVDLLELLAELIGKLCDAEVYSVRVSVELERCHDVSTLIEWK